MRYLSICSGIEAVIAATAPLARKTRRRLPRRPPLQSPRQQHGRPRHPLDLPPPPPRLHSNPPV